MKKKILAIIISAILLTSMLATSVAADGFADVTVDFTSMPDGLEGVSGITLQKNKALLVSQRGKAVDDEGQAIADTAAATQDLWAFRGYIHLTDTLISTDSTVTFWMNLEAYPDGFCNAFPFVLSDAGGSKYTEGENVGGIATSNNSGGDKSLKIVDNSASVGSTTATTKNVIAGEWMRIDLVVDFTAKKTQVYADYVLMGEANFTANAVGYKTIKTSTISSGNSRSNILLDEIVIRDGKITPSAGDVCGQKNRDAIEADSSVIAYEPFDSKHSGTGQNTSTSYLAVVEVDPEKDIFNQSTMKVDVPHAETEFEAYMSLNDTTLKGNATVSFKVKTDYTVNKLPGLKIKLTDANKKVLGGIVMNYDGKLCYDDGTNVYYATDAEGAQITTKTGVWYNVDMLVNYKNHSITVYLDGTRLGTVAMEASDMEGFDGILLSKASTKGLKAQSFSFDNLKVIAGLYVPGEGSSLSDTDALVTIDTEYSEANAADTGDGKKDDKKDEAKDETAGDTSTDGATSDTAEAEEKKGCGSSLVAGTATLAVVATGAVLLSKKRKED